MLGFRIRSFCSQVNVALLDLWVKALQKYETQNMSGRESSFHHPGSIPVEFASAVYRVMHNSATYGDWQVLDAVSRQKALRWVQEVLKANGFSGEELTKELVWWKSELLSKEVEEN